MAFLYITGRGTDVNLEKGRQLYEEAAQQNDSIALFRMGQAHHNGLWGLPVNHTTAKEYFDKAIRLDPSLKKQKKHFVF